MTKEVKLIFHVGLPKTATTTVQSYLEKLSDVFFIGNGDTRKEKSSRFKGLYDLHYKLFKSYRMEVVMGFANPSRSSTALLTEYADKITQQVLASEKKLVVLSDECIGDYYNYIGEWNIFLTIVLGNMIEEKLRAKGYEVKKNLSLTIRQQIDAIKTFVSCSDTLNVRSVDQFFDCYSKNPYEGILGSYYYYSNIRLIEYIADVNWSIQIVPVEILMVDNQIDTYISRILDQKMTNLDRDYGRIKKNENRSVNPITDNIEQILKPRNYFKATGFRFICEGSHIHFNAKNRRMLATRCWGASLYVIGHIYSIIGTLQNKFLKWLRGNKNNYIFCSVKAKKKIQETYLDDNKRLVRYVDENELKKFKYIS